MNARDNVLDIMKDIIELIKDGNVNNINKF